MGIPSFFVGRLCPLDRSSPYRSNGDGVATPLSSIGPLLFGGCLALSWINSLTHIASAHRPIYSRADFCLAWRWDPSTKTAAALSVFFFIACAVFARGIRPGISGLAVFALLAAIRRIEISQWPDRIVVDLGKYVPTAAGLFGYLTAFWLMWWRPSQRAACAWAAACGVAAASYALAGWSKHLTPNWASGKHIGLLIAERSCRGHGWARALRRGVSSRLAVCGWFATLAVWGEVIAGVLFLLPAMRVGVAIAMAALQAGIFILLGYAELEWVLLLFALSWASKGG